MLQPKHETELLNSVIKSREKGEVKRIFLTLQFLDYSLLLHHVENSREE